MSDKSKIVTLSNQYRLATAEDLKANRNTLRLGQIYIVKSLVKNTFNGGLKVINNRTNPAQLLTWLNNNQIYVPLAYFENSLTEIKN